MTSTRISSNLRSWPVSSMQRFFRFLSLAFLRIPFRFYNRLWDIVSLPQKYVPNWVHSFLKTFIFLYPPPPPLAEIGNSRTYGPRVRFQKSNSFLEGIRFSGMCPAIARLSWCPLRQQKNHILIPCCLQVSKRRVSENTISACERKKSTGNFLGCVWGP